MTGLQDNFRPTPAIIISIGSFAKTTASQVRNIYLRSDPRRKQDTFFLELSYDESGSPKLIDLDEGHIAQGQETDVSDLNRRQSAFQYAVKQAESIRSKINQHLHDIRAHDRLIRAGWGEEYTVPINIFFLADSKEPDSAGMVLPLACLLSDIAQSTNFCKVFALINTAVFPPSDDDLSRDLDVQVYSFLLELNDLLEDESTYRENLCEALDCDNNTPLRVGVYLFDSNKEGSVNVKDNTQMQVMVGNALLALLEDDVAGRLDKCHDPFETAEQHSFFNSIGATAIIYDPDSLQKACAARLSREFLETVVLFEITDAQVAADHAEAVQIRGGNLRAWLERCIVEMPPVIGQVRIHPDTDVMTLLLNDLKLADMDYEHFQELPWEQQTRDYLTIFNQEVKPKFLACVDENAQALEADLAKIIKEMIDTLPVRPDIYPGGIKNAECVLKFLAANMDRTVDRIKQLRQQLNQDQSKATSQLDLDLTEIKQIVSHAPKLPWIIRILPKFARIWAAPIFYAQRYGKNILRLQMLYEETIQQVHRLCSIDVQNEALNQFEAFIPRLWKQIKTGRADYRSLEDRLGTILQNLPATWPDFPLGQTENGWDSVFRLPLVECRLADWALTKFHPSFEKWIYEFLTEKSPMLDWRTISGEAINNWIIQLATAAYAPLGQMTNDDIFAAWTNGDLGSISENPVTREIMIQSMHATLPPLKPDFDAAGGCRLSTISSHAILGKPEWKAFKLPEPSASDANQEVIYTGDPYAGFFMQVRHNVPLVALVEMTRTGRHKFLAMPPRDKQGYCIIQSQESGREQNPDIVDRNNPDLVRKEFHWKFKPKGSKVEFDQSICLEISRSRFEQCRRKPRFKGEWNRYAEEEMPEVRALAMEFQRLHYGQNWSAYNQALDVLNFVQSCIPYSYDKDTTGYEDWARYPIETLMEQTGDCEDVAILSAAVISRLGYQTVLLLYPSHLAFGVAGADNLKGDYILDPKTGKRYFYGEATGNGWHIGDVPKKYLGVSPNAILVVDILIQ